jgi:hypothetical protein
VLPSILPGGFLVTQERLEEWDSETDQQKAIAELKSLEGTDLTKTERWHWHHAMMKK